MCCCIITVWDNRNKRRRPIWFPELRMLRYFEISNVQGYLIHIKSQLKITQTMQLSIMNFFFKSILKVEIILLIKIWSAIPFVEKILLFPDFWKQYVLSPRSMIKFKTWYQVDALLLKIPNLYITLRLLYLSIYNLSIVLNLQFKTILSHL